MKRRNLLLSLICSIVMAVALVTFTIVSVVPKKQNNSNNQTSDVVSDTTSEDVLLNEGRDGSVENPYVIYSIDSFKALLVDKYLDEEGNYIDYNAKDAKGNDLYPELKAGLNYELYRDIDFAGSNFVTIFNKGIPFNGTINGQGFSLKNISIHVTKDNLDSYLRTYEEKSDRNTYYRAYVALFGSLQDATISQLNVENINIVVEDDIYAYILNGDFAKEYTMSMKDVVVGTISSFANGVTAQNVSVSGAIDADAYAIYKDNKILGTSKNAIGGMFASADTCSLENISIDVEVVSDMNNSAEIKDSDKLRRKRNNYLGGVAGYAWEVDVTNADIKFSVKTVYDEALFVGGVFGYANQVNVNIADVALNVEEINQDDRFNTKVNKVVLDSNEVCQVAGVVVELWSEYDDEIKGIYVTSSFTDINVKANVNIDAIYAGVVLRADVDLYKDKVTGEIIQIHKGEYVFTFTDIIVESEVDVLAGYGFAERMKNAKVYLTRTISDEVNAVEYNVKLVGKIRLESFIDIDDANNSRIYADAFAYPGLINGKNVEFSTTKEGAVKPVVTKTIEDKLAYKAWPTIGNRNWIVED